MNLFALSGLLTAVTSFGLAIFVLVYNLKNWLNRVWFLFAAAVAWWGVGVYYIARILTPDEAFFWWKAAHVGVILIPVFFVHFMHLFLDVQNRTPVYLAYIFGAAFLLANTTSFFISNVRLVFNSFYYDSPPGILYVPFVIFFAACIIYCLLLLYRKYIAESDMVRRRQILYFLIATIVGFGGGGTSFLPVFGIDVYPILNFAIPLYTIILSVAVLRYQLFDLRIVAAELLTFSIWTFIFIRSLFANDFQDRLIDLSLLSLTVVFGVFLILSVRKEVHSREEISRLAEDLRKANLELKKLDQLKSEFVSLASHQLRTPLTVIKGYISMIQEGSFGKVSEELKDALRKIYFSNERLINLVGDFLNLSRIESGRMKYLFEATSVEEVVQSVYEEFKEVVKEKKLEFSYEKPKKSLPQAMIDKQKFRQVIMNLADNAVKYTNKGFIKLKVEEESGAGGPTALISVSDSGIGMSPEDLATIFKRFARGEQGFKSNTGGLGLGLYLAKRIVTDHGGEIWATSEGLDKGSTLWVRVPARALADKREQEFKEFVSKI